jgi:hypothetical protein
MDHVVRLLPGQTKFQEFEHELLDGADDYKLSDEDFKRAGRDEKILALMWLVRRLVGRYLYHWPITEHLIDEMASAGLEGLCEFEDLDDQTSLMDHIEYRIDQTINNHRSIVRASFQTNRNRAAAGDDLEYAETETLHNVGEIDMDLLHAQLADNLDPEDQRLYYENRYGEGEDRYDDED